MVVNLVWSMKTRFLFVNLGQFQPTTMNFSMHLTEFCVRTIVFIHLVKASLLRRLRNIPIVWSSIFITHMSEFANQLTAVILLLLQFVLIIHIMPQPFLARYNCLITLVVVITFAFHTRRQHHILRPSGPWRSRCHRVLSSRQVVVCRKGDGRPRPKQRSWPSQQ